MNKETRQITQEEIDNIFKHLAQGYIGKDSVNREPNNQMVVILTCELNLGLRLCDILNLTLSSFEKYENRYLINIVEKKTKKVRKSTCNVVFYNFILNYCLQNKITNENRKIFDIHERAVQKNLKNVCDYLGYKDIGTHSFRKRFANDLYKNTNNNLAFVQKILNHSSQAVTLKYLGLEEKELENALESMVNLPNI